MLLEELLSGVRRDAESRGVDLRNLDLVAWAEPTLDTSMVSFASGSHADGNGHLMLEAAGAVWQNPGAVGYYAHGVPDPEFAGEEISFSPIKKTIYVNQSGARFTNEVQYNSFFTGLDVVGQAGQVAWAVADQKVYTELTFSDPLILEEEPLGVADEAALNRLPTDLRTPLLLYSYQGLNTAEIAEIMQISRSAVKMRLQRARQLFGEHYTRESLVREEVQP